MRAPCPVCGRKVGADIPARGDGTVYRIRKHRDTRNQRCPGTWQIGDQWKDVDE